MVFLNTINFYVRASMYMMPFVDRHLPAFAERG